MSFDPNLWQRLEFRGTPIYLRAEPPCWFVPNQAGDALLKDYNEDLKLGSNPLVDRFIKRIPEQKYTGYCGRNSRLQLTQLRELWLHITNRCNLSCRHCLFASSSTAKAELELGFIVDTVREAASLGCTLFALTGGEPTVHPDFPAIVDALSTIDGSRVVVLTNGLGIGKLLQKHSWTPDRFHIQVSLDGLNERHEEIRGKGSFDAVCRELEWLNREGYPFTLSMCPLRRNVFDMAPLVDFAAAIGATNVHFMWYFVRGRGHRDEFVEPATLFTHLTEAAQRAHGKHITIDNIESLKTQVFAPLGTIHDGSTMAWESVAVGPDQRLYPSAALVGLESLATDLNRGLERAWKDSPVLEKIRNQTAAALTSPFRFFLGGGDPDHSFVHGGTFMGNDPYEKLHQQLVLWLIAHEAERLPNHGPPRLRLKMGDMLASCGTHGAVALTHSNCLLALSENNSLAIVKNYYKNAAGDAKGDILNPVCYPQELIDHIPEKYRFRGYGCGSPVVDATLKPGEAVLDLGCGTGVECFIASRLVGPQGKVIGVDMLDAMLDMALNGSRALRESLGYNNLDFRKGYLESLPLEDASVDVAISNCVLNLSTHKRRTFAEIERVLRPGGRLVVADVVCDTEPDATIRTNDALRGACIAGALTIKDLVALLEESGFIAIRFIKRFPYRNVNDHPFFSLTFEARKPEITRKVRVIYKGPFSCVTLPDGRTLTAGEIAELTRFEAEAFGDQLLILGPDGMLINQEDDSPCNCSLPPGAQVESESVNVGNILGHGPSGSKPAVKRRTDCMVCGAPLAYYSNGQERRCSYCDRLFIANSSCEKGHYVCDGCHSEDALVLIENVTFNTSETDMLRLLSTIRHHPAIPVHGPEHHAMVPAIILATYRNLGGSITSTDISTGLRRGSQMVGGACGFLGCCGAAAGVGIAFSIILQSNPVKGAERRLVQTITQHVLADIAGIEAARCCQRESWIALKKAAEISKSMLSLSLEANYVLRCRQQGLNRECIKGDCPINQYALSDKADTVRIEHA